MITPMPQPVTTPSISLEHVSRSFGDVVAVSDLTLDVPQGSVAVLLGPNGAGKTTTVRLITGALLPDQGAIRVLGLDPSVDGNEVRQRCGVVPPKPAMYDNLTGRENLEYTAAIWDAPQSAIAEAADRFGIAYALDQEVAGYSTGMRTRLALARSVLHDPDVLLLDEPTAGLDPESARAVLDLIRELAERGRTIVMCTHLLHEAEGIAHQVVLMGGGTAKITGHPHELAGEYLVEPKVILDAEDRSALNGVRDMPGVLHAEWNGVLHVRLDGMERLPDVVSRLVASGARLTRVEPQAPTLENLYFEMQRTLGASE